jgi:FkbM family methyltransferase
MWNISLEILALLKELRTRPLGNSSLTDVIASNRHGRYCIPYAARHRPAARAVRAGFVWEPQTLEFLCQTTPTGDIIHAGTFFGDFLPALARSRINGARLWAFEPNGENFVHALQTVKLNNLTNVEVFNSALSNFEGQRLFKVSDKHGRSLGGASHIVDEEDKSKGLYVAVTRGDEVIPADRRISAIHLDVERHEGPALEGLMQLIRVHHPTIVVETLPIDVFKLHLEPLGYKTIRQLNDNVILEIKA